MRQGIRQIGFGFALLALLSCTEQEMGESAPGDRPERRVAARVFLVGIDGASWSVLDRAMEAGTMPHLRRLVRDGARGVLRSMHPTASAIVWTTLATGRRPKAHGILGFTTTTGSGKVVPVSSNLRKVKAIWNIASEAGVTVGFLGWWVTWPAEAVRGFMASDYTWPLRKDDRGFATGVAPELDVPLRTFPPGLIHELEPYVRIESRMSEAELEELGLRSIPPTSGYAIRDMMLKDISLGEMSGFLLERYRPSLFAVYFDGYDASCHLYWPAYRRLLELRSRGARTVGAMRPEIRRIAEAVDRHLARIDEYLGGVMDHASSDDVVLVFSDHGYGDNPGRRPILRGYGEWIRPEHWHTLRGIVAAAGGPIRQGASVTGATVLDIAPTVLALLGLPVARDIEGRVLTDLMTERFLEEHPVRWVESYETGERSGREPRESAYDSEVLDRLRSLGYIE